MKESRLEDIKKIEGKLETIKTMDFEGYILKALKAMNLTFVCPGQAGGKIGAGLVKAGFYTVFINTATPDIENLKGLLKGVDKELYKIIKLEGFEGCAKKREVGLQAIEENTDLIEKQLMNDERIKNCTYTFIVAGLGGGTGTGSIDLLSQIISAVMRSDQRTRPTDEYPNGKPTVSTIVAYPDSSAAQQPLLNAAQTLLEIQDLQEQGILGSNLIIDNQKMIDDFLMDETNTYKDWVTKGNKMASQVLTELAYIAWMAGDEALDPVEYVDILSEPGSLALGKLKLINTGEKSNKGLMKDPFIESINTKDELKYDEIIQQAFTNSIFAKDYDFGLAKIGGMAIIKHPESTVFDVKDKIKLEKAMTNFLEGSLYQVAHFGVYNTDTFGTCKESNSNKNEAIIYTLLVVDDLPKRVGELTKAALKKEEERQKRLANRKKETLGEQISKVKKKDRKEVPSNTKMSLSDIMAKSKRKRNISVISETAARTEPEEKKSAMISRLKNLK
ncbi:hypothetical protein HZI73_26110 (plasmid) [Vallitalea pronyensis]|uniref:Tubulin/FtsZ GTPase domain-containing protein n=1 Tax=Vallitalea pronyensis TaxID=1348613 RepID=A0A8J8SJU3_9FIRM|nr:hypothetical protein [Vallitalea pronyensis]QUI25889.1 hypothetical protein HZI73_26110 [Vallitalea pronyensis]